MRQLFEAMTPTTPAVFSPECSTGRKIIAVTVAFFASYGPWAHICFLQVTAERDKMSTTSSSAMLAAASTHGSGGTFDKLLNGTAAKITKAAAMPSTAAPEGELSVPIYESHLA